MAEEQSAHRRKLEAAVVDGNIESQKRGQTLGFVLALVVLVGGFWLISIDKDAKGISLIIGAASALMGSYIYGRRQQGKERVEKEQAFRLPPNGRP